MQFDSIEAFRVTNENSKEMLTDTIDFGLGSTIRTVIFSNSSWLKVFEYAKFSRQEELRHYVIFLDDLNYYEIISRWEPLIKEIVS